MKLEEKVRLLPGMDKTVQLFKRRVIASAQEVELDRQGRILISAAQRIDAGLNSEMVIAGALDKIELWDRKEWDAAVDISGIDQQAVADKLSQFGI